MKNLKSEAAGMGGSHAKARRQRKDSTERNGFTVKKLNHIGIIVKDLEPVIKKLKEFGLPCTEIQELKKFNSRIGFFPIGDTCLEIISQMGPVQGNSRIDSVVRKQKGVINHISLEVDHIEACIQHMENHGARLVEGCPTSGAHGRVAFFYPETTEGILIELCEP